jgi:hypothetical protein
MRISKRDFEFEILFAKEVSMKRREIYIACLALLLTASMSAVIRAQTAPPAYTLSVTPANPTSQDTLTLKLAGTWPDNCPPNKLKVSLQDGNINIDMLLPGAEDGNVPVSKAIKTDWQGTATIGPLAPGTYPIYARGVSFTQTGGYVKIGEIQVQSAPAGQTDPNAGSGQKPGESKPAVDPNSSKQPGTGAGQKPAEMAAPDWMEALVQGIGVVLMDDSLAKDFTLRAGQCGTVVGCDDPGHAGMILVTWPFYGQGIHDACKDADGVPVAYPLKSAQWMDPKGVRLAVCFNTSGTLSEGQGGCVLFKAQDGRVYNLVDANSLNEQIGPKGQFHFGDYVRVQGLLQVTGLRTNRASLCPKQRGDIYCPILSLCPPPEPKVCGPCPGDKLIVDTGHNQVRLIRDPKCPGGKHTLSGVTTVGIVTSNRTALEVTVTACPGVGGTWKASLSIDDTSSDQWTTVKVYVDVEGIDLSDIPAGKEIVVAKVVFSTNK